jgi:hypothetical protein
LLEQKVGARKTLGLEKMERFLRRKGKRNQSFSTFRALEMRYDPKIATF